MAYCLFLLSLMFIVYFRIHVFFRCYHYLMHKDLYIIRDQEVRIPEGGQRVT